MLVLLFPVFFYLLLLSLLLLLFFVFFLLCFFSCFVFVVIILFLVCFSFSSYSYITTGDAEVTVVLQKAIVVAVVEFLALILVKPALRKETRRVTNSCKVEWLRKYMKGE